MKIPKIKFTSDFEERKDSEKIAYLKDLASTMNNAADLMQKERNVLAEQLRINTALLENAEKALLIQKTITTNQLVSGNSQVQELSCQIQELQSQLKIANKTIESLKMIINK